LEERTADSSDDLSAVRKWATPEQASAIDALLAHGSVLAAAGALDMRPGRLRDLLSEAKRRAARAGWSPAHAMVHTVPAGFHVSGVSTLYGQDGTPRGQWVKSKSDDEHLIARLLDACQEIVEPLRGKGGITAAPRHEDSDTLCVYPMGDPHFGMFAWAAETGQDFDLKIAEHTLSAAVDALVGLAPKSEQALVINLGDFFHTDNATNRTMRSGNALDVDSRWAKVLGVGVKTMRACIDRTLEKHAKVRVINEIGNHDDNTSIVLSTVLAAFYEKEPRVEIDCSPAAFHWHRFGKCLIGVTHGDEAKMNQLPGIMAADRAADWGVTEHRHWYTGHVHHDGLTEFPGCTVETFRTLAPGDAWAHRAGFRSGRDMKLDVWHREHGMINRHIVGIGRLGS
jgi:hypothetical protein